MTPLPHWPNSRKFVRDPTQCAGNFNEICWAIAVLKCCSEMAHEVDLLIGHSHGSLVIKKSCCFVSSGLAKSVQ